MSLLILKISRLMLCLKSEFRYLILPFLIIIEFFSLVDQKARKLSNQFDKKLTKEQIVDLKQSRIELEREKNNVIRLQKLTEELESVQLEHRELIAIKDQKM